MSESVNRVLIVLALVLVVLSMCVVYVNAEELLPDIGLVTAIDEEQDLVYITTIDGNVWMYEGIEDLMVGDILAIIFDTMGTDVIFDDQIIQIRYCGYIGWCN